MNRLFKQLTTNDTKNAPIEDPVQGRKRASNRDKARGAMITSESVSMLKNVNCMGMMTGSLCSD